MSSADNFGTRLIVTGHDAQGSAVFKRIDMPEAVYAQLTPGFASARLWATPPNFLVPDENDEFRCNIKSLHPEPGESRFTIVTFPPDVNVGGASFDAASAAEEMSRISPGIVERFERDAPGMHTTDTVDYGIVLAGEIWLELDHGRIERLKAGDVVVQNGTRHAWRNRGSHSATMAFIMLGGKRARD